MEYNVSTNIKGVPKTIDLPNSAVEPGVEFVNPENVFKALRPYVDTLGTKIECIGNTIILVDENKQTLVSLERKK